MGISVSEATRVTNLVNGHPLDPNQKVRIEKVEHFEQKIYYNHNDYTQTAKQAFITNLSSGLGWAVAGGIAFGITTIARKAFAAATAGTKAAAATAGAGPVFAAVAGTGAAVIAATLA